MMEKHSEFDLILMDFLKYIPEPKRKDYELMLRRCNFTDPADPMFSVMLFLLFLQDHLADETGTLTEEIRALRQQLRPEKGAETMRSPAKRISLWKLFIAVLLIAQIVLSVFGVFKLASFEDAGPHAPPGAIPCSREIERMDRYWELKLKHAKKGNFTMNWSELMSGDVLRIALPAAVLFMLLMLLQVILMILTISKLIYSDDQFKETTDHLRDDLHELRRRRNLEHVMNLFSAPPPLTWPDISISNIPPQPPQEPPPVADATAWKEPKE